MPIQVDMTGVTAEGPAPLEPNKYPALITKAEVKDSKNSGTPTLYLELSVGEEGRNLRWNTSLNSSALWRLKRFLVNLGIEVPDGPFVFDEQELIGIECVADVSQEPHYREPERKQNRIVNILGSMDEESDGGAWG